jgi:two-component system, NtrC family, response regulator HydG
MTTPRVLLVDDNVELAENIKEILEDEGVTAEVVGSGAEALARLEQQDDVDLVITDVRMPDIDGLEVLRRIHRQWPGLPVIVMTAYDSDSVIDEAQGHGALGVLSKPLDFGRLIGIVGRVADPSAPVLLVEDDRDLRVNLAEALLEDANVVPHAVGSYAAALRVAAEKRFPIAIIDARLPDGDGITLGEELRRLWGADQVHIIYITGYAEQFRHLLDGLLETPQIRLLEKPFQPTRLLELLQDTL